VAGEVTVLDALLDDVQAEADDLLSAMAGISEADWDAPTPAEGWSVRDAISHLAFFDGVTTVAVTDAEAFGVILQEAAANLGGYVDRALEDGRARTADGMRRWFTDERAAMVAAFRSADPNVRVPWFGPAMSVASKATARLMETWAHGQDVVDALGLDRPPTARLHHVAYIGVRALPNSYRARGLAVPDAAVRVELTGPNGESWSWGEEGAADRVSGPALDFCLVATQRRHLDDTSLEVTGPVATEWMSIAQAFAGPPGPGRKPGQFA
jgi:uncharacterized protein (TIGR03084 family)